MADEFDFSIERSITGEDLFRGNPKLERLAWLNKCVPGASFFFLQDGEFSKLIFQEAADSFVNGQFIAAVVLGFSFIERAIAGRLSHIGEKALARNGRSEELFKAAVQKDWITQDDFKSLETLRSLRNPIVHYRDPLDTSRPEVRAVLSAKTPMLMLEHDARVVLHAAIRLLANTAI
jgi:hypothetical protein